MTFLTLGINSPLAQDLEVKMIMALAVAEVNFLLKHAVVHMYAIL